MAKVNFKIDDAIEGEICPCGLYMQAGDVMYVVDGKRVHNLNCLKSPKGKGK